MRQLCLLALLIICFSRVNAQNEKENLGKLIKKYEKSDGSLGAEISFQLAKEFIKNDTLFIQEMSYHKNTFGDWLKNLQYETFTVYNAEDHIDDLLYKAYYEELKKLMNERIANLQNNVKYGDIVKRIKKKLDEIKVRFID